jgi:predicted SnoaL-like aldol condensation-catalyzing enzyme
MRRQLAALLLLCAAALQPLLHAAVAAETPESADADEVAGVASAASASAANSGTATPVSGHPDPLSLLQDADPLRARNKQLVFDFWRSIVNGGHVELADEMLAEHYVQHSPSLPTGRAAFKQIFSAVPRLEQIPALVSPPLVAIIAEDDLVVMALAETLPLPDGGSYTSTHFNLFRIAEGRLVEHWHSVQGVPAPTLPLPELGGPQPVTGASGTDQLALLHSADPALMVNKRLVFDAWRQVFDAGREELAELYFAQDYIEHKAGGVNGRDGLKAAIAQREDQGIATALDDPLVAMVAQGDLVVQVIGFEYPHPHHEGRTYTTTWFDMFRVSDGRLAEHWDGGTLQAVSYGEQADQQ